MGMPIHGACGSRMTIRGEGAWHWDCDNARAHPNAMIYECVPCRVWDTDRSWERCDICFELIGTRPHLAHAGTRHYDCAMERDGDWYYGRWSERRSQVAIV